MLLDPKEPVAFQPREDGPTYLLRVPRVADRHKFRHAVTAMGGSTWSQMDMVAQAKKSLVKLYPGEDGAAERAEAEAMFDAYTAGIRSALEVAREEGREAGNAALTAALEMSDELYVLFEACKDADPVIRRCIADNTVYRDIVGLVAARMFLDGWDGKGLPEFQRGRVAVDDVLLNRLPTSDLRAIGERIGELLEPSEERLGNSEPELSGDSSPGSSTESRTPRPKSRSPAKTDSGSTSDSPGEIAA